MSVMSRIASIKKELSPAEKKLFAYLKQNTAKIPKMTAEQLAQASQVSAATVVRFVKKIGFESLSDFKLNISMDLHENLPLEYSDVTLDESVAGIKNKMSHNAQITIQETVDILKDEEVIKAVDLLEQKEKIFVAGIGASKLVAEDIVQKWGRIGKNIYLDNDYNNLLPYLDNSQENCVLWLISNSGLTPEIVEFATYAKKLKIPVISLTRFGNNPLSRTADIPIQVSHPKEAPQRSAATNSIIANFLAVDIIFYVYISRNRENAKKIYRSREVIQEFRENFFN